VPRKQQQVALRAVVEGHAAAEPDNFKMAWGRVHEVNALATILQHPDAVARCLGQATPLPPSELTMQEAGLSFVGEATRAELVVPEALQGVLLCASPDALLAVRGSKLLLEAKCPCPFVQRADHLEWEHVSYPVIGLQPRVYAQCQFQMMVTGVHDCLVIWWLDGDRNQSRLLRLRYDPAWCRAALEVLGTAITAVCHAPETAFVTPAKFVNQTKKNCTAYQAAMTTQGYPVASVLGSSKMVWLQASSSKE
jgi:hypothetical protein